MGNSLKMVIALAVSFLLGAISSWLILDQDQPALESARLSVQQDQIKQAPEFIEFTSLQSENEKLIKKVRMLEQQAIKSKQVLDAITDASSSEPIAHYGSDDKPEQLTDRFSAQELRLSNKWEVASAIFELQNVLKLTDEQAKALADLLTVKSDAELDIVTRLMNEEGFDETTSLESKFEDSQHEYKNAVAELLTPQQMETYKQFEQTKQAQEMNAVHEFAKQEMYEIIPSLDSYQKDEIQRFFVEHQPVSLPAKIGSYGSLYAQTLQNHYSSDELTAHMEQFLTPEQIQAYQQYQTQFDDNTDTFP